MYYNVPASDECKRGFNDVPSMKSGGTSPASSMNVGAKSMLTTGS